MRDRVRGVAADVAAAAGLAVTAVVLLWDSLRPGRTVVPADILTAVTPYRLLAGGFHPQNAVVSDAAIQFFPWFHFLGDALRTGDVPGWNPYLLGGLPVTPNGFVSVWYPPFWVVRWLDPFDAYGAFVVGHLWWAALGTYVFARVLGVRRLPAVVVASLALLAGTWVHWSLHLVHLVGMVWLPWALAATHRLVSRPTAGRAAALAVVFGLWWLGGNPQYAYFGSAAMAVYAAARIIQRRRFLVPGLAFVGALALGALVAAPVLYPSARIGDQILREREPVESTAGNHLEPAELIRLVVADARGNTADKVAWRTNTEYLMDSPFVGVTGLLLAGAGVAAGRRRARWILLGIGVGVLLLAVTGAPHHVLHAIVPGYDRFRVAARWLSVLPAVALPLAALGLDALLRREPRARLGVLVVAAAAGAVLLAWWLWERSTAGAPHDYLGVRAVVAASLVAAVAAAAWIAPRWPKVATVVIAGCVLYELGFHTPRWFPSIDERRAYPEVAVSRIARARGGRVVRAGRARALVSTFSSDIPMAYGIADAQGQTVMFPKDVDRYLRLVDDHDVFALRTNVAPDITDTPRLTSPLLDAYDARTVLAESNVDVPSSLPVLRSTGEPRIYANPGARPATVVERAVPATEDEMWDAIAEDDWDPDRTAAVVGLRQVVAGSGGTVRGGPSGSDRERWVVSAPDGGVLRVGSRFAPGWRAEIDGRNAPVLRADGIFRAVVVPPGRHVVTFDYANPDERTGAWAGAAGALGVAVLVISGAVTARRRNGPDGSWSQPSGSATVPE